MIIKCKNCGIQFNNQLVNKCPICFKKKKNYKSARWSKRSNRQNERREFMKQKNEFLEELAKPVRSINK